MLPLGFALVKEEDTTFWFCTCKVSISPLHAVYINITLPLHLLCSTQVGCGGENCTGDNMEYEACEGRDPHECSSFRWKSWGECDQFNCDNPGVQSRRKRIPRRNICGNVACTGMRRQQRDCVVWACWN